MDATTAATAEPTVVTLTGGNAVNHTSTFARGGWRFLSNGTCIRIIQFSDTQFAPLTDWIIPNGSASANYKLRVHLLPGGQLDSVGQSPLDTFLPLDSDYVWSNSCSRFCFQTTSLIIDIRWLDGSDTGINNVISLNDGINVMATNAYGIDLQAD